MLQLPLYHLLLIHGYLHDPEKHVSALLRLDELKVCVIGLELLKLSNAKSPPTNAKSAGAARPRDKLAIALKKSSSPGNI